MCAGDEGTGGQEDWPSPRTQLTALRAQLLLGAGGRTRSPELGHVLHTERLHPETRCVGPSAREAPAQGQDTRTVPTSLLKSVRLTPNKLVLEPLRGSSRRLGVRVDEAARACPSPGAPLWLPPGL